MIPINNASKYHRTVAAFGKMMLPTVAAHNLVFLSCMLLDKFLEKTVKTTSEIAGTGDEQRYKWKKVERTEEVTASWFGLYGCHQRENTGSRLFTEVKPCWTGLISGWVTI